MYIHGSRPKLVWEIFAGGTYYDVLQDTRTRAIASGATVNISGKPKGHGSCVSARVVPIIQSLYRTLCPPLIQPYYPEYGLGSLLRGHPHKPQSIETATYGPSPHASSVGGSQKLGTLFGAPSKKDFGFHFGTPYLWNPKSGSGLLLLGGLFQSLRRGGVAHDGRLLRSRTAHRTSGCPELCV